MKSTDVAVYVADKFVRFVRPKQFADEVAGKVLKRRLDTFFDERGDKFGWRRVASRRRDGAWSVRYESVRI